MIALSLFSLKMNETKKGKKYSPIFSFVEVFDLGFKSTYEHGGFWQWNTL